MAYGDDIDLEDEGLAPEGPEEHPTVEELRAAAHIAVFLEHDVGLDMARLRVRVRQGIVRLQGSLATREQMREIEERLPLQPGVRGIDLNLSVVEGLKR
jgi:hypothetical protein